MKRRFLTSRAVIAVAVMAAGGSGVALWAGTAGATTTSPLISKVASHGGAHTVTLGHPQPEATAKISPSYVAYDPTNKDEAVVSEGATGNTPRIYLIAGANEANEYNIETAVGPPAVHGPLLAGDVYLVAGDGTANMDAQPGYGTTTAHGQTATAQAVANPIAPLSVAFDNNGNLLIGEFHNSTGGTRSGIQLVAKAACTASCGYGYGSANSQPTMVAGGLYTVAGVGSWPGETGTPAIVLGTQVLNYGMTVDSAGDIITSSNGVVYFLNETGATIATRYGKALAPDAATKVAGTATHTGGACVAGGTTTTSTGQTAPNFQWPHPAVDASGNIYINDDRTTAAKACTWVLPAGSGTVAGQSVTVDHLYSLTGPGGTAGTTGVAKSTANPNTWAVTIDEAGNVVLAEDGTSPTPTLKVIAESTAKYYNVQMTKGDEYTIGGAGATTTVATPPATTKLATFKFAGAARGTSTFEYGLTSLTTGAPGDLLVTNGSTAATGNLYQTTLGPTQAPHPTVTTLSVTGGPTVGGTAVTIHGTAFTGVSSVTFGGTAATIVSHTSSTITVTTPAHAAGAVTVTVVATLGTGTKTGAFTYAGPTTTHVTLTVSGTRYKNSVLHLLAHVTPTGVPGKVRFQITDPTTVTVTVNPATGLATTTFTLTTDGPTKIVAHFTPTHLTAFGASTSAATLTSQTFTVTTRPATGGTARQTFQVTVVAGRLTLSCTRYATVETAPVGTTTAVASIKTCKLITFPSVHLNGVTQTRTAVMQPLYVYTARGTATAGWALSATMVPTVAGTPVTSTTTTVVHVAPAADCATYADFCDSTGTLGGTIAHGQIPATDFSLSSGYTCAAATATGNTNPSPITLTSGTFGVAKTTPHPFAPNLSAVPFHSTGVLDLCTAAAGTSGGKYKVSGGHYSLTVPPTVRHGNYYATVLYSLVSTS